MFTSNFRRCPLAQKLTGSVFYLSKSCTFCPLGQTQLDFLVKSSHVVMAGGCGGFGCRWVVGGCGARGDGGGGVKVGCRWVVGGWRVGGCGVTGDDGGGVKAGCRWVVGDSVVARESLVPGDSLWLETR
ncbi:hypothetical protein Hanom_Chr11g00991141 [Helianthus anomalus]